MRLRQLINIVLAFGIAISMGLIARDFNRGNCSEAVLDNALDGGAVQFAKNCMIELSGRKAITGDVTISGGVFLGDGDFAMFNIREDARLILENVTIKRGNPAIINDGEVLLRNSKLQDNTRVVVNRGALHIARTQILDTSCIGCNGAVIYNEASAIIEHSRITRASALPDPARQGAPAGGAIFNRGEITVSHTEITRSRAGVGGAIFNLGRIHLSYVNLSHNEIYALSQGVGHGGAIDNHGGLVILNSQIERNTTYNMGGGINNHQELLVRNSIIANNRCTSRSCTGANVFNYAETGTTDMVNNYWGHGDNPAEGLHGVPDEAYTPYLTEKPSWAR